MQGKQTVCCVWTSDEEPVLLLTTTALHRSDEAHLKQLRNRGASSSVKVEALFESLLQPAWKTGGHVRQAPLEHGRHHLHLSEALIGQLAGGKVQHAGGKAPHICVSAPEPKLSIHLLWSPICRPGKFWLSDKHRAKSIPHGSQRPVHMVTVLGKPQLQGEALRSHAPLSKLPDIDTATCSDCILRHRNITSHRLHGTSGHWAGRECTHM